MSFSTLNHIADSLSENARSFFMKPWGYAIQYCGEKPNQMMIQFLYSQMVNFDKNLSYMDFGCGVNFFSHLNKTFNLNLDFKSVDWENRPVFYNELCLQKPDTYCIDFRRADFVIHTNEKVDVIIICRNPIVCDVGSLESFKHNLRKLKPYMKDNGYFIIYQGNGNKHFNAFMNEYLVEKAYKNVYKINSVDI